MYVEIYQFDITPEEREDFLQVADENCKAEVREDPGTLSASWVEDEDTPNRFYMVSVFTDRAARDAHHAGRHASDYEEGRQRFTFTVQKVGAGPVTLTTGGQVIHQTSA